MKTLFLILSTLISTQAMAVGEICEIQSSLAVEALRHTYHEESLETFQDRLHYDQSKVVEMFNGTSKTSSRSVVGDTTAFDCFSSAIFQAQQFGFPVSMSITEMVLAGMNPKGIQLLFPGLRIVTIRPFAAWKLTKPNGDTVEGKVDLGTSLFRVAYRAGDARCPDGRCLEAQEGTDIAP